MDGDDMNKSAHSIQVSRTNYARNERRERTRSNQMSTYASIHIHNETREIVFPNKFHVASYMNVHCAPYASLNIVRNKKKKNSIGWYMTLGMDALGKHCLKLYKKRRNLRTGVVMLSVRVACSRFDGDDTEKEWNNWWRKQFTMRKKYVIANELVPRDRLMILFSRE